MKTRKMGLYQFIFTPMEPKILMVKSLDRGAGWVYKVCR